MPKHTALLLDHDAATTKAISAQFMDEGLCVVSCRTAGMLRHELKDHHADLCLIGAHLPGEDSMALVRELRAESRAGLIVLGESTEEVDAVIALEMGADDYVAKPVRLRELSARARSVMRRTLAMAPAAESDGGRALPDHFLRRLGDLEICGITRQVRRNGAVIDLTTLEFDVLMVLAASANEVLSRTKIIETVHGPGWSASDRTVDGIISRLRRKIFDEDEGAWRIRTLHRRGYMLVDDMQAES